MGGLPCIADGLTETEAVQHVGDSAYVHRI
jgi:hypothetical protein